jgi:hypothetical protein
MRHMTRLFVTALFAALLAACGGEPQAQAGLVGRAQPQAQASVGLVGRAEPQAPLKARMEPRTP